MQIHATCTSSAYSVVSAKATTNQIVTLFPFMPLLVAALLSFMPCTACSGLPHNATHSASNYTSLYMQHWQLALGFEPMYPDPLASVRTHKVSVLVGSQADRFLTGSGPNSSSVSCLGVADTGRVLRGGSWYGVV